MYCAPEASARLATVMCELGVPLPGAKVLVASTVTLPTEPPPISVPDGVTPSCAGSEERAFDVERGAGYSGCAGIGAGASQNFRAARHR